MPRQILIPLLLAALAAAGRAQPQAPSPPAPVFRAGTELVNVTVTVLDRSGHLVNDLGAADFAVYEDGRPQAIEVFGRAFEGEGGTTGGRAEELLSLDLGMLMDTSESMLKPLRLSQQAAVRFLDAIPRARDLATIFFDQDIQFSRYDSEQQQGLVDRIQASKGGGRTALYDAIAVYVSRCQDSAGRKVMVLFSDGEDTSSEIDRGQVVELVRSSFVTVYPIAFDGDVSPGGRVAAKAFLQHLAELSGGEVFVPQGPRDLPGIYQKILDQLKAQYVVGFSSDNPRRDGKYRRLRVELKRKDLRVRHRDGYYAPGDPPARRGR